MKQKKAKKTSDESVLERLNKEIEEMNRELKSFGGSILIKHSEFGTFGSIKAFFKGAKRILFKNKKKKNANR